MSKDLFVLTPDGRRVKINCLPDTNLLQVLEEVCKRHGYRASEYDLKHHNNTLDLGMMLRYCNLPNKAVLEMVEATTAREEMNVTIGLQLEDGERRTGDFSPYTSLFDVITTLAPTEIISFQQPTIMYMRQEVIGLPALKENTLRNLGLLKGRAILRLMNKPDEVKQANVSAVYRRPVQDKHSESVEDEGSALEKSEAPGPSKIHASLKSGLDPVNLVHKAKEFLTTHQENHVPNSETLSIKSEDSNTNQYIDKKLKTRVEDSNVKTRTEQQTQENLERRLQIEDEVTFLGAQKAVAYRLPDTTQDELEDLPDDFYELTIEEVRKLYKDLQEQRIELENTPLVPANVRAEFEKQNSKLNLIKYKNAVVRVQFPDHMILQGIFSPNDTIRDVINFIKQYLKNPDTPFHIFTTPFKELDPELTLIDAKFVPCVHFHFALVNDNRTNPYLKDEVYLNQTQSDAASILASKYRAPSRRKADENPGTSNSSVPSTSKDSKVPKWFKK